MSDGEEDYMSESILSKTEDVKPGVSRSREARRQLIISRRDVQVQLPRHEIEAQRRQEALAKPVSADNKGFALLAKMGYKPGMSLGKDRASENADEPKKLTEPIAVEMKFGRGGLGRDQEAKEQQAERCEAHMKKMAAQAKMSDMLAVDFRKRKQDGTLLKTLVSDVVKSRKACQDLDLRLGISSPEEPYLWPIHREVVEREEVPIKRSRFDEVVEYVCKYSTGEQAPEEPELAELPEDDLLFRLRLVTNYLRGKHHYCVWCGCAYEDGDDLSQNCPGSSREEHDQDGEEL